jgi:hypothetical protein
MIRCANVYERPDRYIVCPQSRTRDGVWILDEPIVPMRSPVSTSLLGDAVLAALEASRVDVQHPESSQLRPRIAPFLRAAGVRSYAALQREARLVVVSRTETQVSVVPCRNRGATGPDRGYEEISGDAMAIERDPSSESMGSAVVAAFKKCQ